MAGDVVAGKVKDVGRARRQDAGVRDVRGGGRGGLPVSHSLLHLLPGIMSLSVE